MSIKLTTILAMIVWILTCLICMFAGYLAGLNERLVIESGQAELLTPAYGVTQKREELLA